MNGIYETHPLSRQRPLKGYVQLVRICLYAIAGIILVTALMNVRSVAFLSPRQIQEFSDSELLGPYMAMKRDELAKDPGSIREQDPSRRRLMNIGTFRASMNLYIDKHPGINQEMIPMVRQLRPTADGLPLQKYAFTRDKAWILQKNVQSDIMDHVLAVIPRFGLRVYQHPGGGDIREMARMLGGH